MAKKSKKRMEKEFPLECLSGGDSPPDAVVRRGMADLEKELTTQFREQRAVDVEIAKYMKGLQAPLIKTLGQDDRVAAGVRGLKEIDARLGKQRLTLARAVKEKQRIFVGSVGATVSPPYNYEWTWNATSGSPSLSVSANRATGQMSFSIWNNGNDASGSARAALGIYFRPMVENGILRLSSSPAFNYRWHTICAFASAHSDGFIGLYVGRYNLSGGFDGAPVNQIISLWNDDSWWSGAGSNTGSNSGFPLFAQFNVDSSHWYALWVWCGGRASGAGWGVFSGSGAASNLNVTVPSMTWELF